MANNSRKKWIWVLVALIFVSISARAYYRLTDDFRLGNISYPMPFAQEWEVNLTSRENQKLEEILNQSFSYLGKGAQSYAFASQDGKYVLKFFKFKHLRPNWFVSLFPPFPPFSTYKEKQLTRKNKNLYGVFQGYHNAFSLHREDSGLIYIHLNLSKNRFLKAQLFDKIGMKRSINLNEVVFIVQERAKITRQVLAEALSENNIPLAKQRIKQIFSLYLKEYQKGIYDKDHGVLQNTGFVGSRPIHLDVGKMVKSEKIKTQDAWQPDLENIAWKLFQWLETHYPNTLAEISKEMEENLREAFKRPFTFASSTPPKKH